MTLSNSQNHVWSWNYPHYDHISMASFVNKIWWTYVMITQGGGEDLSFKIIRKKLYFSTFLGPVHTVSQVLSHMRLSIHPISSLACNSTIASNKQGQGHNNLATIQCARFKGPMSSPRTSHL